MIAAGRPPQLNFVVLMVFLGLCGFMWLFTGSGQDDSAMFPARDGSGKAWHSGFAMSGDSLSAVTLMAFVGLIAFTGYDGLTFSLSCVMGLVLLALLIAEPLRRSGGHTVGDALARRFPGRSVRTAVALVTLGVCLPYLVLQLSAIGAVAGFVFGLTGSGARTASVVLIGILMISLAVAGGMRGTARVQIVKVIVLLTALAVVAALLLHRLSSAPGGLLGTAAARSGLGDAFLAPGVQYGTGAAGMLNRIGLFVSLALGMSCLPQVTMRVLTAPQGRATRTATHWAVAQQVVVSALLVVIGFGTVALLGAPALHKADPTGSGTLLVAAQVLDPGGALISVVSCVVFLAALSTIADVTVAAASTVARDLFPRLAEEDGAPGRRQERRARTAAMLVGVITIALAVQASGWNLFVLSTLAITLAASALAPALVYGLLWPRFTGRGALWCLYGTSLLSIALVAGSPLISGSPSAAFPGHDFHWLPLVNVGVVTVPAGFALGWLGSVLDQRSARPVPYTLMAASALLEGTAD